MNASGRVLRQAGAADAAAIAAVLTQARAEQRFLPALHTAEEDYRFVSERMLPSTEVWVVEEQATVVGFAAFSDDLLGHLYVMPRAQRHGIGQLLLEHVKLRRPNGFTLWTHQPNAQARRFYEHEGLRPVEFTDGSGNEEKVPDVRYAWRSRSVEGCAGDSRGNTRCSPPGQVWPGTLSRMLSMLLATLSTVSRAGGPKWVMPTYHVRADAD